MSEFDLTLMLSGEAASMVKRYCDPPDYWLILATMDCPDSKELVVHIKNRHYADGNGFAILIVPPHGAIAFFRKQNLSADRLARILKRFSIKSLSIPEKADIIVPDSEAATRLSELLTALYVSGRHRDSAASN